MSGMPYILEAELKNKLRVLRAERNWSQGELSQLLGVSRQAVNAIETEKHDPSLELAFKIAQLFQMPIEQIFAPEATESQI
jgi:putative transcriptional regulator